MNNREVRLLVPNLAGQLCPIQSYARCFPTCQVGVGQTAGAMSQKCISKGGANCGPARKCALPGYPDSFLCINCTAKQGCAGLARERGGRTKSVTFCVGAQPKVSPPNCRRKPWWGRRGSAGAAAGPLSAWQQTNTLAGSLVTRPFPAGVEGPSHAWPRQRCPASFRHKCLRAAALHADIRSMNPLHNSRP